MWLKRDLSLIGKNIILKSLAISKLVFLFSVLPNPQDNFFNRLKKIITKFLWYNKPAKIQYSVLMNGVESGGLKLLDPVSFCIRNSLKISWVQRIRDQPNICIYEKGLLLS